MKYINEMLWAIAGFVVGMLLSSYLLHIEFNYGMLVGFMMGYLLRVSQNIESDKKKKKEDSI